MFAYRSQTALKSEVNEMNYIIEYEISHQRLIASLLSLKYQRCSSFDITAFP